MRHLSVDQHIQRFVHLFSEQDTMPGVENLYDTSTTEGTLRAHNLTLYLTTMQALKPTLLLIGEAPGYQGTRRTGVPFASEYILQGNMSDATFFRANQNYKQVFTDGKVGKEPTSTIMWKTISKYEQLPLLWATFPHHPHIPGNIESNRAPTRKEVQQALPLLKEFLALFPIEHILAVGNIAKKTLDSLGIESHKVRHPSHGGATVFARQLNEFVQKSRKHN